MKINTFDRSLLSSIDKKLLLSIFYLNRILENFNVENFITFFFFFFI